LPNQARGNQTREKSGFIRPLREVACTFAAGKREDSSRVQRVPKRLNENKFSRVIK